jgi:hypothetical protein
VAFQEAFLTGMEPRSDGRKFRYIQVSGAINERDQEKSLWFINATRKIKVCVPNIEFSTSFSIHRADFVRVQGQIENRVIEIAKQNSLVWEAFIVRPGIVFPKDAITTPFLQTIIGNHMSIRGDELGAFLANLAMNGHEQQVIDNAIMVSMGKALIAPQK